MLGAAFTPLDWLAVVHRELLLFSCLFFALGSLDEFAIDILYLAGRLSGRIRTPVIDRQDVEGRDPPLCPEDFWERLHGYANGGVVAAYHKAAICSTVMGYH